MVDKKNVIVIGGAGYIGSHTCKQLDIKGYNVIVYDNLVTGNHFACRWGEFIYGDIKDTKRLIEVMQDRKPVAIIHFAAHAYVGESVIRPDIYYENNVSGTLSVLEAMRITKTNNIIFSSTCATYGEPDKVPVSESQEQKPINPYGRSKLMIESILKDYNAAFDINHVVLRYFNAAGADPEGEIGEKHDPETHIIPLLLNAAAKGGEFKIFGDDYDTFDGTCVRDYIHVQDLASAHVKSLEYLLSEIQSNYFNLGNGKGYSVRQIINSVMSVTGKDFPMTVQKRRPGDPPVLIGDSSKAKKVLGWEPEFTELDDIISTAWNWHKNADNNLKNV